jgi:hypothetical protein
LSTARSSPVAVGWCPTLPNLAPFLAGVRETPGTTVSRERGNPREASGPHDGLVPAMSGGAEGRKTSAVPPPPGERRSCNSWPHGQTRWKWSPWARAQSRSKCTRIGPRPVQGRTTARARGASHPRPPYGPSGPWLPRPVAEPRAPVEHTRRMRASCTQPSRKRARSRAVPVDGGARHGCAGLDTGDSFALLLARHGTGDDPRACDRPRTPAPRRRTRGRRDEGEGRSDADRRRRPDRETGGRTEAHQ